MAFEIALLARPMTDPPSDLLEFLPLATRKRAKSFSSSTRLRDYYWARLLLCSILVRNNRRFHLVENPPQSPRVLDEDGSIFYYTTISHTGTYIGVAFSRNPVAIDLEVMKARDTLDALFERMFGAELLNATPDSERLETFYRYWGLHECGVKLQGTFRCSNTEISLYDHANRCVDYAHQVIDDNTILTIAGKLARDAHPRFYTTDEIESLLRAI